MFSVRLDGSTSLRRFWIIIYGFGFVLSTPVGGQLRVRGPQGPVVASPGDDVVLQCLVEPAVDVGGYTVEWSKSGLEVNPADPLYVYMYRNRRRDAVLMFPSYVARTTLRTDALKDGSVQLLIRNVTTEDDGEYTCLIPHLSGAAEKAAVTLVVDPNYVKMTTTETPPEPRSPDVQDRVTLTDRKGGRHHVVVVAVVALFLLLVVGVGTFAYMFTKFKRCACPGVVLAPA